PTTHRVPGYAAWLEGMDHAPVYASHRRWLQYLQWKAPARRWMLKSPGHLWTLDALLREYPDACIVQTHRDPLRVLASLVSLVCTLRPMASDDVDPREGGAEWSARLADGMYRTMAVRDRERLPSTRVFDMRFREFLRDEIAMVRRIYTHFGMDLSSEAE